MIEKQIDELIDWIIESVESVSQLERCIDS